MRCITEQELALLKEVVADLELDKPLREDTANPYHKAINKMVLDTFWKRLIQYVCGYELKEDVPDEEHVELDRSVINHQDLSQMEERFVSSISTTPAKELSRKQYNWLKKLVTRYQGIPDTVPDCELED